MKRLISEVLFVLPREELDAAVGLLAAATGADVVALCELMLEPADV
jgi:hypothetical protein